MTSRFLWTYSAAARHFKNPALLKMADFAYRTIVSKYWDSENGGVYWSVLPDGTPCVSKKQIYGEAFCCYGLCEYAAAIKELRQDVLSEEAMNYALDIYNFLEQYAFDSKDGGYLEACAQNWSPTDDMILSPKDMNCPKSMNTNLHVMEAYTNLYRTLPFVFSDAKSIRAEVGDSLAALVRITADNSHSVLKRIHRLNISVYCMLQGLKICAHRDDLRFFSGFHQKDRHFGFFF